MDMLWPGGGDLLLAYAAGSLVVLSPCVLPALPLVTSGAAAEHRLAPLVMGLGLAAGFALAGTALVAATASLGLDPTSLRSAGAVAMGLAGLVLLVPALDAALARLLSPLAQGAGQAATGTRFSGLGGHAALGALMGAVWAPCSGPALGAAIGLAAQAGGGLPAAGLMAAFGLGAASPLLAVAYGSRGLLASLRGPGRSVVAGGKRVLGAMLLGIGALVLSGGDVALQDWITARLPDGWLALITRL